MREIYLDNAATTRTENEVVKEMEKYYLEDYGNPSSLHKKGEEARKAIDEVRREIALEIGCKAHEIVFTSGATESNNLVMQGVMKNSGKRKIIVSAIEHPSVSEVCDFLGKEGFEIVRIGVDGKGKLNIDELEKEIDENTEMVSVMFVNNVFGTIQDIRKIGKLCKERNVIFHTDAVQGFGKLKIDVNSMNVDLFSASGHKIGGPKGVGFLYVREGVEIKPIVYGGGQERGIRSGTENVTGIVGMGKALEIYKKKDWEKVGRIRDLFIEELEKIGGKINGSNEDRIYNNIHVSFKNVDAEDLIMRLSSIGIYVSAGSACDSKKMKEDLVLKAIGLSEDEARGSIRISLSDDINEDDVSYVVGEIKGLLETLRP
jgi:cysteine desulfurase